MAKKSKNKKIVETVVDKKYKKSDLDFKADGVCDLVASKIKADFATYFKTRDRYRDGARVGYDRLFVTLKADSRDWIKNLGLTGDCLVFGLGNKNIDFISQDNKVFYSTSAGTRSLEYVKAWSQLLESKYGSVEIFTTDLLPRGPKTTRSGGKKIKSLDDLMTAALSKAESTDYGI
jgi:hypothetical protein